MKRRQFIQSTSSALAGALTITNSAFGFSASKPKPEFGLQLYTLRDVIVNNPQQVLSAVAKAGYKKIESYDHDQLGIFMGMKNKELKSFIDSIGLKFVSSHYKPKENFEKIAFEAAEIGVQHLFYPYEGTPNNKDQVEYQTMPKTIEEFKVFAGQLNKWGAVCKKNGIRYGFHNHDYTFSLLENQYPEDILLQYTDKDLVDFELDMYWVITAGLDPITWLKKYPGRFVCGHVKDRTKNVTDRENTCTLGTGIIDYSAILPQAKKYGMKHFIVEQEHYQNTSPLQCIIDNANYLKSIKF